ncbi:hypothetical protein Cgig2_027938 [Carnegiea gigantea]|uniref:Mannose-P-dolichol utilization defect 1 protein homolog n=1 Tax=Carnegiea gigantea TaxID=171969 RepID=A0A9Q1GT03_9CARY|nr:hypothetical protein Cgig2_027938 [Carnegiea gigantea]
MLSGLHLSTMEIFGMDFGCVFGSLRHGRFPGKDCLLPLISKLLGYCIVTGSTTVKIPQIMKILEHKSVRGLSLAAFELEVIGYTISLAYCLHNGLPFSAFGEYAFLLVQAIILVAVTYYYSQPVGTGRWMRALLYCGVAPTILAGKVDPMLFEGLYASQHAIFLCARIPQIWKNFRNKSTGELSFITCFMNFGGSTGCTLPDHNISCDLVVRVFTSIQERAPTSASLDCKLWLLDSTKVVTGSVLGAICNGILLGQIIVYRKPPTKKEKKDE